MQRIARELNLSETVFVLPAEQGGDARIRIFTPATSCRSPGIRCSARRSWSASARPLDRCDWRPERASSPCELERTGDRIVFGRMQQPIPPWGPYEREARAARRARRRAVRLPVEAYRNGPLHVYVALESEEAVAALEPDSARSRELDRRRRQLLRRLRRGAGRRGCSRPAHGVAEDPATGSAAGPLAVHLARHGRIAFGDEIEIRQGVEIGRPSVLYARAEGSPERIERVEVGGSAVIVAHGEYRVA